MGIRRTLFRDHLARGALIRWIAVRVQERDGDRLHAVIAKLARSHAQRLLVERHANAAVGTDPLRHADAEVAWDQRLRLVVEDVVETRPRLIGDLEHICGIPRR